MAVFLHGLLDRHEIAHWLDYGSLLGAVRSGELIPWDPDVDFSCLQADFDKIVALESEIAAAGYLLDLCNPLVPCIRLSQINRLHVDIFPWYEVGELLQMDADPLWVWHGARRRMPFPRKFVAEFTTVSLYNHSFPAPSPVHDFLSEHRYGPDYMRPMRGVIWRDCFPDTSAVEMTPSIRRLLDELGRAERRLLGHWSSSFMRRFSWWQWWVRAGLPETVSRADYEIVLAEFVEDDGAAQRTAGDLVESLALLRRIIDEMEQPATTILFMRCGRRLTKLGSKVMRTFGLAAGARLGERGETGSKPPLREHEVRSEVGILLCTREMLAARPPRPSIRARLALRTRLQKLLRRSDAKR